MENSKYLDPIYLIIKKGDIIIFKYDQNFSLIKIFQNDEFKGFLKDTYIYSLLDYNKAFTTLFSLDNFYERIYIKK